MRARTLLCESLYFGSHDDKISISHNGGKTSGNGDEIENDIDVI